ncbi:CHASE4 domain-containing protein [Arenimonas oryziterrae]|uniref:histidine kinase n=1 Tax=Arenimonas oryziterrae DSM 21050 = YC6267 TaxID=1121015 RepID=A0A091BFR1_9GAMM|nr:CHASE4 domain-containing protein [Arenimonas oryziterrae]KFN43220.1 hypothetical protein N789_11715 [Arenimonas oryziterrae DSM 21050 = YC6267]
MSLRRRTLLIGLLLMLVTAVAVHLVQYHVVYPRFLELEREQARRNAELVFEVVNRELALVAPQAQDWGYWDATYSYMGGTNPTYETVELIPSGQQSLGCQILAYYDNLGRRVWSRGLDLDKLTPLDIDAFRGDRLPINSPLLAEGDAPQTRAGLIDTNLGLMFVTSAPVLSGARTGPRRGTVIMGRLFEIDAIRQIADQNHLQFEIAPPLDQQTRGPRLEVDRVHVAHGDLRMENVGNTTRVTAVVFDINGRPVRDISVITPREISARGWSALTSSMTLMALTGLVIMAVLLLLLDRGVVQPLLRLTELAGKIGADENNNARLKFEREDEIGELADEFDRMLDRLADTRHRLFNESYRTGAYEMAGGVIADLRKSLEPLKEHVDQPLKLLDRTQTAGMQMLLQELSTPNLSHHRHMEIVQMLQYQTNEQSVLLAEARGELRAIRKSLEHLQGIVTEYSRFITGGNTLQAVAVRELVEHALRKLDDSQRQTLTIDLDGSVYQAPLVLAAREVLQQVINLIIGQSAEGPRPLAGGPLQLRITAGTEFNHGRSMVHFRFDDNRPPVKTDALKALFEREWRFGDDVAGLSLPWAENVIASMGGKLYAEASQPFDGLVMHLLLPRAKIIGD